MTNEEEKKEEEPATGNIKEIINGEQVTTVVTESTAPVTETTTASSFKAPVEKQVKIIVGQQE